MLARPVPAAALLCPAVLLLACPTATAAATNASSYPCAPAPCVGLNITFPFCLAGTHPPECGYRAFQVTCGKRGSVYLMNSYSMYALWDIDYENSSIIVAQPSGDPCDLPNFFYNASSDFGLSPFKISSKNQELFFLYDCQLGSGDVPRSWTNTCPASDNYQPPPVYAFLGNKYTPGGVAMPPPMNYCSVWTIPVRAFQGATGADYRQLLDGAFLLEYTDGGACAACKVSGGQCRV